MGLAHIFYVKNIFYFFARPVDGEEEGTLDDDAVVVPLGTVVGTFFSSPLK